MVLDRQLLEEWLGMGLQPPKKGRSNKPIDLSLSPKDTVLDLPTSSGSLNGADPTSSQKVAQDTAPEHASSEVAKHGSSTPTLTGQLPSKLANERVACKHGLLDYREADLMKRVNLVCLCRPSLTDPTSLLTPDR
jgi:hypothetical protein